MELGAMDMGELTLDYQIGNFSHYQSWNTELDY